MIYKLSVWRQMYVWTGTSWYQNVSILDFVVELRVTVTTGAIRRAKLQSHSYHNKPTPNFLQAGYCCCCCYYYFRSLFNWLVFQRLCQVRSGPPKGLPKKILWELLVRHFYRPDVLPVTQSTVSNHRRAIDEKTWRCQNAFERQFKQ